MNEAERKLELATGAASDLLAVLSRTQKVVLAGLSDRPSAGEKALARKAHIEELKAIQQFRSLISGLRDNPILGSRDACSQIEGPPTNSISNP